MLIKYTGNVWLQNKGKVRLEVKVMIPLLQDYDFRRKSSSKSFKTHENMPEKPFCNPQGNIGNFQNFTG